MECYPYHKTVSPLRDRIGGILGGPGMAEGPRSLDAGITIKRPPLLLWLSVEGLRRSLTLATAGGFCEKLQRALLARGEPNAPIWSPEGLRLLGMIGRPILLTSGLDDAEHFTSPTIAGG